MSHAKFLTRCLQLATYANGRTAPNPMVGAVIVHDGVIIGEGYHQKAGDPHAEVMAINSVEDKSLLASSTLYCSLEPCAHFGKTPPCADLIIKSEIKKVVIGCLDSNVLVAGKGIERLQNAGCEVIVGVLEKECKAHHKRFFTFQTQKRPFIILKWAQTLDAFIAPKKRATQAPVWITKEVSRQLVHKWRSEEQAILVGTTTVLDDNPGLDVRYWNGENPVRIVIDRELKILTSLKVHDGSVKTIFINERNTSVKGAIFFEKINFLKPIAIQICAVLFKHNIQSLIVEGGTKTIQTFIDENLWDEARVFSGEVHFNNGVNAPTLDVIPTNEENIKGDILKTYLND